MPRSQRRLPGQKLEDYEYPEQKIKEPLKDLPKVAG